MTQAIVVGAGAAGATFARLAAEFGARVTVLERRLKPGGNAIDEPDAAGVLTHRYGPHIFHTSDGRVYAFLSRFTAWRPYEHRVAALVNGRYLPVPFNLTALERAFGESAPSDKLLAAFGEGGVSVLALLKHPDADVRRVGEYVYENIYREYSRKQWGEAGPDPSVLARVPVRLSRDDRYFTDEHQAMPLDGYTALFARMLDHPNISAQYGTDAKARLRLADGRVFLDGAPFEGVLVYTGALDELFENVYGPLPYRTLDIETETLAEDEHQPYAVVNYTVDQPYTRVTEFKKLTGQVLPGVTTIAREYARAAREGDERYYPIPGEESRAAYLRYLDLAKEYPSLHPLGRLAEYRYYNMDAAIGRAMSLATEVLQ